MVDNVILNQARQDADSANGVTGNPALAVNTVVPPTSRLLAVQDALAQSGQRIAATIESTEQNLKESQQATDLIQSSIVTIGEANQMIQTTRLNADLQAQNNTIEAFESASGSELQSTLLKSLNDDIRRSNELAEQKADIVDDEFTGIGIIDNLINTFRHQSVSAELQVTDKNIVRTSNQLNAIATATESVAHTNNLTKKTLNEGSIEANSRLLEAQSQLQASEAELKNLHSNAVAMTNLANADARRTANLMQLYRLEGEAEQRDIQRESFKFRKEEIEHTKQVWKTQLPASKIALEQAQLNLDNAKTMSPTRIAQAQLQLQAATKQFNDQAATEETLVDAVRRGQATSGVTVEDRETIIWGLNQSGEMGAKYDKLLEVGSSLNPVLGLTPAESFATLGQVSPSGNYKPTKITKLLDQVQLLQAEQYKQQGAAIPKTREGLEADFNTAAKSLADRYAANIAADDGSNPYQAPPMGSISQVKAVQDDIFFQKVIAPTQMSSANPVTITREALAAIKGGVVTPEEAAAGIERIYEAAALLNNTQDGGFARVGLPNQTTYNTTVERRFTFFEELSISASPKSLLKNLGVLSSPEELVPSNVVPIDLMDKAQIQLFLVEQLTAAGVKIDDSTTETP